MHDSQLSIMPPLSYAISCRYNIAVILLAGWLANRRHAPRRSELLVMPLASPYYVINIIIASILNTPHFTINIFRLPPTLVIFDYFEALRWSFHHYFTLRQSFTKARPFSPHDYIIYLSLMLFSLLLPLPLFIELVRHITLPLRRISLPTPIVSHFTRYHTPRVIT